MASSNMVKEVSLFVVYDMKMIMIIVIKRV